MKIAFHCGVPFFLAHGGMQIQIEQTKAALESAGVEVEYLRWWDDAQKPDIIQGFGRPGASLIEMTHAKQIPFVISDLLTAQGSRSALRHALHHFALAAVRHVLPRFLLGRLPSRPYNIADACLALTPLEAYLMRYLYGAPPEKVHVIPNGVEEVFLNEPARPRGTWLVCTATITERKKVLELARAAVEAKTPVWIIGKPYADADPYYVAFKEIAESHPDLVRYEGPISDRGVLARIYREARGFVLLSTMESLSLSALEAAACECPLLLSDLPWARVSFEKSASYCPIASTTVTARHLRHFYDAAPTLPVPPRPLTWREVGEQLREIYERLLKTSR